MPSRRSFTRMFVALAPGLSWSVSLLARADEPPLLEEHFTHLLKVVDEKGTKISLPPSVAGVLDLKPGAPHTATQVAFQEEGGGTKHGFARLDDGTGYFMFSRLGAHAY